MNTEYNGWTNRETWATALHINNDEGLYNRVREMADEYTNQLESSSVANESWLFACYRDEVMQFVDEILDFDNVSNNRNAFLMLQDIGSLYRVNWREIAESFVEEKVSA